MVDLQCVLCCYYTVVLYNVLNPYPAQFYTVLNERSVCSLHIFLPGTEMKERVEWIVTVLIFAAVLISLFFAVVLITLLFYFVL